ncbi:MAG: retropepsin-like aspartic protease [Candidatus Tyrphobacter sp.]
MARRRALHAAGEEASAGERILSERLEALVRIGFVAGLIVVFGTLAFSRTAADTPYLPTAVTAAQLLAKANAAAGTLASGSYLVIRQVSGSDWKTLRMTQIVGNDSVTIEQEGLGLTQSWGTYHGQNWFRDENGIVMLESGFHDTADPNSLAWQHVADPQFHVRVLGLTQGSPSEYVVEANPPGGQDQYEYINAQTFLVDRVVTFEVDRRRHVTTYADYRTAFGKTVAFDLRLSDGDPADDEEVRTTSFASTPTVDPAAVTMPTTTPMFSLQNGPVRLAARFTHDDGFVVGVQINGQTLDFTLDTGSSELLLDEGAARRLGLTISGGEAVASDVTFGNVHVHRVAFSVAPMTLSSGPHAHVVGLLGCDFLASAIVGFDFKTRQVTLNPWSGFDPHALGVRAMPIQMDDCVPRVGASFEGVAGSFLLDTGGFGTLLYHHYLDRLPRAGVALRTGEASPQDLIFESVAGNVHSQIYDVQNMIFGPLGYRTGQVVVPDSNQTFQDPDYDGIIGRNVLKEYLFYLDYNDGLLFIKDNT